VIHLVQLILRVWIWQWEPERCFVVNVGYALGTWHRKSTKRV